MLYQMSRLELVDENGKLHATIHTTPQGVSVTTAVEPVGASQPLTAILDTVAKLANTTPAGIWGRIQTLEKRIDDVLAKPPPRAAEAFPLEPLSNTTRAARLMDKYQLHRKPDPVRVLDAIVEALDS